MMKKVQIYGNLCGSSLLSAETLVTNEDVMREIFLHLPVRTLIRFKLVSKHWFSLIADPHFCRGRTSLLNPKFVVPSGLFFYNCQKIKSISFLQNSSIELSNVRVPSLSFLKFTVLQSCNGLLLCRRFTLQIESEYCVCNPTTKTYKILPQLILNDPPEIASGFTLGFDPSISPYYKVVSFASNQVYIYSSETGTWSASNFPCNKCYSDHNTCGLRSGFYWDGSIYCISQNFQRYRFIEYDFKTGVFKESTFPESLDSQAFQYFGESKDCLHLVSVDSYHAMIFERSRNTSNWMLKYHVNIDHMLSNFPEKSVKRGKRYAFSILTVYKGEKEEDSALVLTRRGKVVSFNLHYKTYRVLHELPHKVLDTTQFNYHSGFNFIESLALV